MIASQLNPPQTVTQLRKKSYSYQDLAKVAGGTTELKVTHNVAPRAVFGSAKKSIGEKLFIGEDMAKVDCMGRITPGPGAYITGQITLPGGKEVRLQNQQTALKFSATPQYTIGSAQRKEEFPRYTYMQQPQDHIDIDRADLARKNSAPVIRFSTSKRFTEEREDRITPAPIYDAPFTTRERAPKYSMASKQAIKGVDPSIPNVSVSTTPLVGPASYFQRPNKSHSVSSLSRVPLDSTRRNEPVVGFTKQPKEPVTYRSSTGESYDVRTNTIMAKYNFDYDSGKGFQSENSYRKDIIARCSQNPLQRNKMGSYTMGKAPKQKDQKRGMLLNMMSQVPVSVRLPMPKF